jgi:hypothetical protein
LSIIYIIVERVFDPILQNYREPAQEVAVSKAFETQKIEQLNQSRVRQLKHGQSHDIISHKILIDEPKHKVKDTIPESRVGYNIVSGLGFKDHHFARPDKRWALL